jgi:hypothetical protein
MFNICCFALPEMYFNLSARTTSFYICKVHLTLLNMRIPIITFLALSCISMAAYSQDAQPANQFQLLNRIGTGSGNMMLMLNESYYGIEGTPYHIYDFLGGSFHHSGVGRYEQVMIRYNAYEDWLEIVADGDSLILNPKAVRSFEFIHKGTYFLYRNGYRSQDNRIERENYLQVLHEGSVIFLKRHNKVLKEANFDPVFNTGSKYDRFVENESYYTAGASGDQLEPVRLRRRDILNMMADNSDQIVKFARDNRLNYRSEADVLRMLLQYDHLKNEGGNK